MAEDLDGKVYRRCVGCDVLVEETWVFCSDECRDVYYAGQGEMDVLIRSGFTKRQRGWLLFVRWSLLEGLTRYSELRELAPAAGCALDTD